MDLAADHAEESSRRDDLELYERLCLARRFDLALTLLVKRAQVHGFLHLSLGQEATAVGACSALQPNDLMVATHRSHAQLVGKGADPSLLMAEVLGRQDGYCHGRGGEMHVAIPELGVIASTGTVGGSLPLAVGAGVAAKLKYPGHVVLCFFGDGASAQGTFHESLNMATVLKLPVIFLCEVNHVAEMSKLDVHLSRPAIAERADVYGCHGRRVDGNDVEAVRACIAEARQLALDGLPVLVESDTYLLSGHYDGAPQTYRTKEEVADAWEREPLERYRRVLLERGHDEAALVERDESARRRIDAAVSFALESPLPEPQWISEDVYA